MIIKKNYYILMSKNFFNMINFINFSMNNTNNITNRNNSNIITKINNDNTNNTNNDNENNINLKKIKKEVCNIMQINNTIYTNYNKLCKLYDFFDITYYNNKNESLNDTILNRKLDLIKNDIINLENSINNKIYIKIVEYLTKIIFKIYDLCSYYGYNIDSNFCELIKILYSKEKCLHNNNFELLRYNIETYHIKIFLPLKFNNNLLNYNKSDIDNILKIINNIYNEIFNKLYNNEYHLTLFLFNFYKLGLILGINCNKSFDILINSEYTKIISNKDNIKKNIEYYKLHNIECKIHKIKNKYIIKKDNTILNSLDYKMPNFDIN